MAVETVERTTERETRNGRTTPPIRLGVCRDLGHAWGFSEWTAERRVLVCTRCTTERVDKLNRTTWTINTRAYHYAKQYRVRGGREATSRVVLAIRKALFRDARRLGIAWIGRRLGATEAAAAKE